MIEATAHDTALGKPSFDIRAGQFRMPTLVLRDSGIDELDGFLAEQVRRKPGLFDRAPVAIDITAIPDDERFEDFPLVVGMLRGHGMIPVGVRGASEQQQQQATALELALLPAAPRRGATSLSTKSADRADARPMIVEKTVRSGQRIFAERGDLILMGGVSSGAEVMAEGHIHAYGPLRGRAMAGVKGFTGASVFCRDFGPDLVAIAGRYRVSEKFERRLIGRAVRISLSGDALDFRKL